MEGLEFLDGLDFLETLDALGVLDVLDNIVFLDFFSEGTESAFEKFDFLAQLGVFLGESFYCFSLVGAIPQAGGGHAFAYSAFGHKFLLFLLLVGQHHLVYHSTEGDADVGHFLIRPFLKEGFVCRNAIVVPAVVHHLLKTGMGRSPFRQLMRGEIIFKILQKFLNACSRHIQQLQFQLHGSDSIGRTFNNVLFARPCRLNHLVNRPVTIRREEPSGKGIGELVEHHSLLIEPQFLPIRLLAQNFFDGGGGGGGHDGDGLG